MSLKYALLAALSSSPQSGYDLAHNIDGSIGFFWSATHQQIYLELKHLESAGWVGHRAVMQTERPDKKVYRLSPKGLTELRRWIAMPSPQAAVKDALLIKVFSGHLVAPEKLLAVLDAQAREHEERLAVYRGIVAEHFPNAGKRRGQRVFPYLTLRRGILHEEAWLRWVEEARGVLKGAGSYP